MSSLKEVLQTIIEALVDDKSQIEINESEKDGETLFEVKVAKEDMGRVIGKGGKIANAVRTLVQASSYIQENKKIKINIDSF